MHARNSDSERLPESPWRGAICPSVPPEWESGAHCTNVVLYFFVNSKYSLLIQIFFVNSKYQGQRSSGWEINYKCLILALRPLLRSDLCLCSGLSFSMQTNCSRRTFQYGIIVRSRVLSTLKQLSCSGLCQGRVSGTSSVTHSRTGLFVLTHVLLIFAPKTDEFSNT